MNQTMEDAIVRAKAIYEQITGEPAPEPAHGEPYARIPPEVDAEEYVTMKAASLLETVRSIQPKRQGSTVAPQPGATVMRALPIPAAVIRSETELRWVLEMPGVPRSAIEVELRGQALRVSGMRPAVTVDAGDQVLGSDLVMGRVERMLTLPMPVDPSHVQANLADGLLTVRVRLPVGSNDTQRIEVR